MKETFKITAVLTFVCLFCAFLLSLVWGQLENRITENENNYLQASLSNLAPKAKKVEEIEISGGRIYKLFDLTNTLIGYGFTAIGQGYQDKITILAVIDAKLINLQGIEILKSSETPGLGAKIQEKPFLEQFKNKNTDKPLECVKTDLKDGSQIKAITSATVSSRAVVRILNSRIESLREQLKK